MKKFLLVVVLLLVATVAAAPWIAGIMTEKELQAKVAEVKERTAWMNVSLALEDYQRGYASSTAIFRVEDQRVPLEIKHAPFSATGWDIARITIKHADNSLPDSDLRVNLARQLLWKQEYPAAQKGDEHFSGGEIVIRGPEKTFPYNNQLSVVMRGSQSKLFSISPTQFDFLWNKDGLSIRNELFRTTGNVDMQILGLRAIFHTVAAENDALPLRLELGVDGAHLMIVEDNKEVSKLSFSNSSYENGLIQSDKGYDFIARHKYNFQYSGENFAEIDRLFAISPDSFSSQLVIGNLSPDTVRAVMRFTRMMFHAAVMEGKKKGEIDIDMAFDGVTLSLYQDLLMRDLSLKSQMELSGAGKGIRLEFNLLEHFKNNADLDEIIKDEKAFFHLLQGSSLHMHIDQEWLARGELAKKITPEKLEQMGFVADEKGFTLNFSIQEDGLVRNGKLLSDEELAAIPQQFDALFSGFGQ